MSVDGSGVTARLPDIVLVHCHDLGRYLGCYGRPIETPNIDAIAANRVRFDQHFAASPTCSPSRATMYTGRSSLANSSSWLSGRSEPFL